jgi:predicted nucleotidyltransferase
MTPADAATQSSRQRIISVSPDFGASMSRPDLVESLHALDIPAPIVRRFPRLARDVEAVLIYGSRARGDAVDGSDLDVLALVPYSRPSLSASDISVSFYTEAQLQTGVGTLFGAHLRRDAKVIWDPSDRLSRSVHAMGDVDTVRLLRRAKAMSSLFTTKSMDLPTYLDGMLRQARYLLRSCLYAKAIEQGDPCFSVREIARRLDDPKLTDLLASRRRTSASVAELEDCLRRLAPLVGGFPESLHGSLEATVVNEWGKPGDLLSAAFLILGSSGTGSVYAEVEKILL